MILSSLSAALFGGTLCLLAQILIDKTKLTPARILSLYVVIGVALYAVGAYEPLLKLFGCGITLPLIGFGGAVGRGVKRAVDADGIIGALTGPFTAMAAGAGAALILGFLASLFFSGKQKRM